MGQVPHDMSWEAFEHIWMIIDEHRPREREVSVFLPTSFYHCNAWSTTVSR